MGIIKRLPQQLDQLRSLKLNSEAMDHLVLGSQVLLDIDRLRKYPKELRIGSSIKLLLALMPEN